MNNKALLKTLLSLLLFSVTAFAQPSYKEGDAVEIEWYGAWFKGRVLEIKDGKYKITYDGYSSSSDEWVDNKRLRRVGETAVVNTNNPAAPVNNTGGTTTTIFKKGDRVEVNYGGDWSRATIIGGPEGTSSEASYKARMDGSNYDGQYLVQWVRSLYRPNEKQNFTVGNKVLFRRWDGKEYEAEVVGADGGKYHLSYMRDGYQNTEWVPEIGVKESPNNKNTVAKLFPGQRFKIGDRVQYNNGNFLTGSNYGTVVSVDVEKRLYTIKDEKDASSRYSYPCYGIVAPGEKPDNSFFVGKWEVSISGATSTFVKDGDLYRRFSGGIKLKSLEIKADGTYTWVTDKKTISGSWKPREGVPGITILKGLDGLDWTVYQNTEAFAVQKTTRDEIRFHHIPSQTGYYMAYRIGPNKSCVLQGRDFR